MVLYSGTRAVFRIAAGTTASARGGDKFGARCFRLKNLSAPQSALVVVGGAGRTLRAVFFASDLKPSSMRRARRSDASEEKTSTLSMHPKRGRSRTVTPIRRQTGARASQILSWGRPRILRSTGSSHWGNISPPTGPGSRQSFQTC